MGLVVGLAYPAFKCRFLLHQIPVDNCEGLYEVIFDFLAMNGSNFGLASSTKNNRSDFLIDII
jgi:hypothetical protein